MEDIADKKVKIFSETEHYSSSFSDFQKWETQKDWSSVISLFVTGKNQ